MTGRASMLPSSLDADHPTPAPVVAATGGPSSRDLVAAIAENAEMLLRSMPNNLNDAQRRLTTTIIEHADRLRHQMETSVADASPETSSFPRSPSRPSLAALPCILLADDDEDLLDALGQLLSPLYQVMVARDGAEARAALLSRRFELAILDVGLPVVDGLHLIQAVQSEGRGPPVFMFLSARSDPQTKVHALSLGAADYMTKPFESVELLARIKRILAAAAREAILRADARTDSLTGLGNYKSFVENVDRELERSRRYRSPLSLITVDIDNLKLLNDQHGHESGNDAIRLVAGTLARGVRRFEMVARQGGDEFAIILPNTASTEARRLAERLRIEIGSQVVHGVSLSVSIGGASWEDQGTILAATLINASDEALYRAKRAGRNRVDVGRLASE